MSSLKITIHQSNERGDIVTLLEPLLIEWGGKALEIPSGFESDGVSTPEFLWGAVSPAIDPRTLRGAVAHDFVYRTHPSGWTRYEADNLFYDLIREDGLSWYRSQKAYWGVRLFGGSSWKAAHEGKK